MAGSLKVINGEVMIAADAIPQFALWAVSKGYAPPSAFGRAVDVKHAIHAHFAKAE